ncbi:MAG: hypothetical protein JXJ22_03185 [Bacteroidales bacterium]|nr:hypothetical protein [Bacteroidales bacterium]
MRISIEDFVLALKGKIQDYKGNTDEVNILDRTINNDKKDVSVTDETFSYPILIDRFGSEQNQNLVFTNCNFKAIEIKELKSIDNLKFLNCKLEKIVLSGHISKIEIRGCQIGTINLLRGVIKRLVISGENPFNGLYIVNANIDLRWVENFYLLSAEIKKLNISRIPLSINPVLNTYHKLDNLIVDHLTFTKLESGKNLFIKRIHPASKESDLVLLHTDLSEAVFQDCDFKGFKFLKTRNSNLEGIKSENIHWFQKVVNWNEEEDIISYRQLKAAMLRQHDKVSEIYFRAKEMDAYLKWLKFRENKSEWLLLQANKLSNQHGLSWVQGIKFSISIALIYYTIYLLTLKGYPYVFGWKDLTTLGEAFSYFIGNFSKFFIITHDFDFMLKARPRGISYFIDVLGRIFISYGIYQTIQAFRKYGR